MPRAIAPWRRWRDDGVAGSGRCVGAIGHGRLGCDASGFGRRGWSKVLRAAGSCAPRRDAVRAGRAGQGADRCASGRERWGRRVPSRARGDGAACGRSVPPPRRPIGSDRLGPVGVGRRSPVVQPGRSVRGPQAVNDRGTGRSDAPRAVPAAGRLRRPDRRRASTQRCRAGSEPGVARVPGAAVRMSRGAAQRHRDPPVPWPRQVRAVAAAGQGDGPGAPHATAPGRGRVSAARRR